MRQLPRCPLTDLIRLECGCPDHSNSFTMTEVEQDYLNHPDPVARPERLYPVLRKGDYRPLGIGEYLSLPWTEPRDVKVVDSTNLCGVAGCTRPAGTDFVCRPCVDDLEVALGDVPALMVDLLVLTTRQSRFSGQGGGIDRSPLPFVPKAGEASGKIQTAILSAVKALVEHRGIPAPRVAEAVTGSRWLLANIAAVPLDPAGPDIITEIVRETKSARHLIDRPRERSYIGLCANCQAKMYARDDQLEFQCRTCGTTYTVAARRQEISDRVMGSLLSLSELSDISRREIGAHLSLKRLEGWVRTGIDPRSGKDRQARLFKAGSRPHPYRKGEQQPLYRTGDVLRIAIEMGLVSEPEEKAS